MPTTAVNRYQNGIEYPGQNKKITASFEKLDPAVWQGTAIAETEKAMSRYFLLDFDKIYKIV
ncbi:MAG: hypothetical protein PVG19_02645 [Desulfobacterales bacterium]|jgi:hypothetical protein